MDATERLRSIIDEISFRDWRLVLDVTRGEPSVHVEFHAPDPDTGEIALQRGRRWTLEPGASRGQIVQTVLMAVLAAVEHEAREEFRYRGQPVFSPHTDVEALHEMAARRRA